MLVPFYYLILNLYLKDIFRLFFNFITLCKDVYDEYTPSDTLMAKLFPIVYGKKNLVQDVQYQYVA